MPARVFLSSVIRDYGDFREAARRGIEAADCEPVLAEDFPSLAVSPRTACLDAVQSCDVFVGVLGTRAGSEAPSGRTVVGEEFEEAHVRGLPILFFVQEGEREPRQEEFLQRISKFVGGRYRNSFSDPEALEREVERALQMLDPSANEDPEAAAHWVSECLERGLVPPGRGPTLRVAFAPIRQEEVVDPREIRSVGRELLGIGHSEDVGLLSYESGYETELLDSSVRAKPVSQSASRNPHSRAAIELYESGRLVVETNVTDLRERPARGFGLQVVEDDVAVQLRRCFALVASMYDEVDEYGRHQGFVYQAGLFNLGHRSLVAEDQVDHGGRGITMGRHEEVTAYPEPRPINRRSLANPTDEVERTLERFRRVVSG